jgi:hypothetical protein
MLNGWQTKKEKGNMCIRGPFERFVDWRQCAAVMQREAVTVMPSCCSGVIFVPLTVVRVTVVLKEPFLGWRSISSMRAV